MAKKTEIDPLNPVEEIPVDETPGKNTIAESENEPPREDVVTEPENEPPVVQVPEPPTPNAPQPLDTLATTHRVPGWQQAALARLMGWEDGKMVTVAEYQTALELLGNRKQGGGRI